MVVLQNTSEKGIYTCNKEVNYNGIMVYSEKPENYYPAVAYLCRPNYPYFKYEVYITVCGKKQRAVRPDKIYLFKSINEYKEWFNKNKTYNKDMESKKVNLIDLIDEILGTKDCYTTCDSCAQEKSVYDMLFDAIKDGIKNVEKKAVAEQFKYESESDGTIELKVMDAVSQNYATLTYVNSTHRINGAVVDKETFDKAMEVFIHGGKVSAVINSIDDILAEYLAEYTKELADKEHAAKLDAKREELQEKIAEMQAELDALK